MRGTDKNNMSKYKLFYFPKESVKLINIKFNILWLMQIKCIKSEIEVITTLGCFSFLMSQLLEENMKNFLNEILQWTKYRIYEF